MLKIFSIALILLFASTTAFAGIFSPTQLLFSAPATVQYGFGGTPFELTYEQTGTDATIIFVVNTKGKAESIVGVHNGNMGWHYMNKIDTCVYISEVITSGPGSNVINWDGRNTDGGIVESDDYTYYIWGYDHISQKQRACPLGIGGYDAGQYITKDEAGNTLSQPRILGPLGGAASPGDITDQTLQLWTLGNDPADVLLIESTIVPRYVQGLESIIQPDDWSHFITMDVEPGSLYTVKRYEWVPDDYVIWDQEWGEEDGMTSWNDGIVDSQYFQAGCEDIGGGEISVVRTDPAWPAQYLGCESIILDLYTGEKLRVLDLAPFHVYFIEHIVADDAYGVMANRGPSSQDYDNGRLYNHKQYGCSCSCINPHVEEGEDCFLWSNFVGDGVKDFYTDNTLLADAIREYTYEGQMDSNWFESGSSYDLGATSFHLITPDGTGVGYFNFAGETAGGKNGIMYLDSGSIYDGMYCDYNSRDENHTVPNDDFSGQWFIGQDSITGTITPGVGIAESAPTAYTVAQNSPNPFNPTTTISFSLGEAGSFAIDVYNVAGQKIDTLVNEFMDAGSHSVVWDASDFSAGVYFYTVKSGDFSKTMKMTLIK